jgi:hypothetical protein
MKDHLIFDVTDATTRADTDNVGAWVRAGTDGDLIASINTAGIERLAVDTILRDGAGTALTSTLVGGKQSLDVNVTSGINVEVDLSHLDDSVRLGDGTSFFTSTTIGGDIALDVFTINDPSVANAAIASAAETLDVANTAQDVVAAPLASRKYLFVYNNDNQKMWIGQSGVTSANGFPISPGSYMELKVGSAVDIEFVSAKIAHEIRTLEIA